MYKNNAILEKENPCVKTDRSAKIERLEKIEIAVDKLRNQSSWFQSLLDGE